MSNQHSPTTVNRESLPHTLATLTLDQLGPLIDNLLSAPIIQPDPLHPSLHLNHAFKTSFDLKLVSLDPNQRDSFFTFGPSRPGRIAQWLETLLASLTSSDHANDLARLEMLTGLLQGIKGAERELGRFQVAKQIEIEVLVLLDQEFLKISRDLNKGKGRERRPDVPGLPSIFPLASIILPLVPISSVASLSLSIIASSCLEYASRDASKSTLESLGSIMVRIVEGSSLSQARPIDRRRILSAACCSLAENHSPSSDYTRSFALPLAYVISQNLIIHPLSSPSLPALSRRQPVPPPCTNLEVSSSLILTLFHLSSETDALGGLEGEGNYGKTWWGLVDILTAADDREHRAEWKALLERIRSLLDGERLSIAKHNYFLLLAEQIIPLLRRDEEDIIDSVVLPICEKHLEDDSNRQLFESSHSTMLAILSPLSSARRKRLLSPDAGRSALKERLILSYSDCLIRNAASDQLSLPQLRHAFRTIVSFSSEILPTSTTEIILYKLTSNFAPDPTFPLSTYHENLIQIHVSLLSRIPRTMLPLYLWRVEKSVLSLSSAGTLFRRRMVEEILSGIGDVGDEGKAIVVEWWLELVDSIRRDGRSGKL